MEAVMKAELWIVDREETVRLMEPTLLAEGSRHRERLTDAAFELVRKSAGFRRSMPESLAASLADMVRTMDCYYSNLIDGHNTHPVDIERALNNDYRKDTRKRDLQKEARAHIAVQEWIDGGRLDGGRAVTVAGITELHRRFCEELPEDPSWIEDPTSKTQVRVLPGEFRMRDVQVRSHVAVSPGAVPRFMERFEEVYGKAGKSAAILATAAAHQRPTWVHPFPDGNGRVARLMSHAVLRETLDTAGVWSVARGLARNATRYKSLPANCDLPTWMGVAR